MPLPRLTRDGKANCLLFGVVLFAAFNTGTNLVYLLASTIASLLIVSIYEARSAVGKLKIQVSPLPEVIEGDSAQITIQVTNIGKTSANFLRARIALRSNLGIQTTMDAPPSGICELLPGETGHLSMKICFPLRGAYEIEGLWVESSYPLGLVTWPRPIPLPRGQVLALPRLLPIRFRGVSAHQQETLTEETRAYERGDGADFYGLRPYQRGDPLKFINWKSSAKTGKLVVQEFQKNLTARYYLFLDLSEEKLRGKGLDTNLETSVRLCATLCNQLAKDNCLSQILIYQDDFRLSPPVFTAADAPLMFRFLSGLSYIKGAQLDRLLEKSIPSIIPDSHLIFILVDLSDATLRQILRMTLPDQKCIAIFNLANETELDEIQGERLTKLIEAGVRPIFHLRSTEESNLDLNVDQTSYPKELG